MTKINQTILTVAIAGAIIGTSILYARAVDVKTQRVMQTSEKKDGQVTVVQHTAAPVSVGKDADSLKARCDEAINRVARVEDWMNQLEERLGKLEGKTPEIIEEPTEGKTP